VKPHVITPDITIENASLSYASKLIFNQINLHIPAGQWLALLGPSGVGKSSLLRLIAGLTTPQEQSQARLSVSNGIPLHEQIAYMAQTDLLLPWMNVLDNATLGMKLRNQSINRQQNIERAKSLLTHVGLEHVLHHYPQQLSGGMRQRVALVRTLMEDKPIVLMDEPFSALDAITRYKLQALSAELLKHKTVLFITHDPTEALRLANEIYLMQGMPARLKSIASLSSAVPRSLTDPQLISLQALLFDELSQAAGAA
jgi:putative hydroxymethylpyrimidine transport system ATP-binding protein